MCKYLGECHIHKLKKFKNVSGMYYKMYCEEFCDCSCEHCCIYQLAEIVDIENVPKDILPNHKKDE